MQIKTLFSVAALLIASASAAPSSAPADQLFQRGVCKPPKCSAHCPDKTPYDCCVDYIMDPCLNHYKNDFPPQCTGLDDMECLCKCATNGVTYFCNAEYFVDPCLMKDY